MMIGSINKLFALRKPEIQQVFKGFIPDWRLVKLPVRLEIKPFPLQAFNPDILGYFHGIK